MIAIITVLVLAQTAPSADPPDLRAHIIELRRAGITERGASDLLTVARVLLGESVIEFPEETPYDGMAIRIAMCPRPGLSQAELAQLEAEAKHREVLATATLKGLADSDHSGFVSSSEASALRDALQVGLKAAHIATQEPGVSFNRLLELLSLSPAEFTRKRALYQSIVAAFPDSPAVHSLPAVVMRAP